MVVCYWRPFSKSNGIGAVEMPPLNGGFHQFMEKERNRLYAHTDEHRHRQGGATYGTDLSGPSGALVEEYRVDDVLGRLDEVISVCEAQDRAFSVEAIRLAKVEATHPGTDDD